MAHEVDPCPADALRDDIGLLVLRVILLCKVGILLSFPLILHSV